MKRYYFDYAGATPVDPVVERAMRPYWSKVYGNPGALHWFGQEASAAIFEARNKIAKSLGCHYKEIVFTGSATEANNLALRGAVKAFSVQRSAIRENKDLNTNRYPLNPKIIVSAIEHESILETCYDLEQDGVEVVYLPVSQKGIVDLKKLKDSLTENTVLVSVMYANNEIGTIQPISKISALIRNFRNERLALSVQRKGASKSTLNANRYPPYPLFHTDAAQAFNYLNCQVNNLGVDLMTLSSQKIYGPKGVGLLYQRLAFSVQRKGDTNKNTLNVNRYALHPIITGGGQEFGLRGGTENVPGIVGFAKAIEIADKFRIKESKRLRFLQEYLLAKVKKMLPNTKLNGDRENRLPNNVNLYFPLNPPKTDRASGGQDLIIKLDLAGFAVSPGAACAARVCKPSHVLKSLGYSDEQAKGSLRITFGRSTTKNDIDKFIEAIKNIIEK